MQGQKVTAPEKVNTFGSVALVGVYGFMLAVAVAFDLLSDRSHGAILLSTIPISVLAILCLLIGPWLSGRFRRVAWRGWAAGSIINLAIVLWFSGLGAEQAKVSELVFTYAVLIGSLPGSLVMPFGLSWLEPLLRDHLTLRLLAAWTLCVMGGLATWSCLRWISRRRGHG
jgi:hypothetical protein